MTAKRRKIVAEDFDHGSGATTIPTDSGGTRAATKVNLTSLSANLAMASLPAAGTAGRVARVSDGVLGLWMDTGTQWIPLNGRVVNPMETGAKFDGRAVFDGAMSSSGTTLTSLTGAFTSADVGKLVAVEGAGASSATLFSTISALISGTQVTLANAASTTVSSVMAVWATDDTTAIQAAIDTLDGTDAGLIAAPTVIELPFGIAGVTRLRLHHGTKLIGSAMDGSILARMGVGAGGSFIAMTTDEVAQKISITDLSLYCMQAGTNNDGLDLGTQGNAYAYANGSWIHNVRVLAASGIGVHINANVGHIGQIWVQNQPGSGTPAALARSNTTGVKFTNTQIVADLVAVEGRFDAGDVILNAGGSRVESIHCEPLGTLGSVDLISIGASYQTVGDVFITTAGATRRDIVRITGSAQYIDVGKVQNVSGAPVTATNLLNDTTLSITVASDSTHRFLPTYRSDDDTAIYDDGYAVSHGKRFADRQGTSVAAANDLTFPLNGNVAHISGNTEIRGIKLEHWFDGAQICLIFSGTPTVKHNTAASAGYGSIFLAGAADMTVGATDYTLLTLRLFGTEWWEVARSLPTTSGTYTPTLTGVANVAASTAYASIYYRVGQVVNVSGRVDIDPTAAAPTDTQLGISLPVASDFTDVNQLAGVGANQAISGQHAGIFADTTNNRANLQLSAVNTGNAAMWFQFSYLVV